MSKVVPMPPEPHQACQDSRDNDSPSPMGRRRSTGAALVAGIKNFVTRPVSRGRTERSGSLSVANPNHYPHALHSSPSPISHGHPLHHGLHLAKRAQAQRAYCMRKVQIAGCKVESVYDLRGGYEGASDFYDDQHGFRRPRSNSSDFLILRKTSRPLSVDVVGLVEPTTDPYRQYMKALEIYELLPNQNSIITIDKTLRIDKAFTALVDNNVGCALVWDGTQNKIVSIVTLSDFLRTLKSLKNGRYQIQNKIECLAITEIHEEQLAESDDSGMGEERPQPKEEDVSPETTLGPVSSIMPHQQLVQISCSTKIFDACLAFNNSHVHRLVVTEKENGNVLGLLTLKRILTSIHKQNRSLHFAQWLSSPIKGSNVGSWVSTIISASVTDTVEEAVSKMLDNRVSGVPLVNELGEVVNVLIKNDVARAFSETPIKDHEELLLSKIGGLVNYREPYEVLHPHDSVGKVLDTLLASPKTRSVFVVNPLGHPVGCISLSDIIRHLTTDSSPFQRHTPQDQPEDTAEEGHNPKKK